jgi:hypothetical protein
MMEVVNISETSVKFYQTTRHSIPEGNHLHTRRRGNLYQSSYIIQHVQEPSIISGGLRLPNPKLYRYEVSTSMLLGESLLKHLLARSGCVHILIPVRFRKPTAQTTPLSFFLFCLPLSFFISPHILALRVIYNVILIV